MIYLKRKYIYDEQDISHYIAVLQLCILLTIPIVLKS